MWWAAIERLHYASDKVVDEEYNAAAKKVDIIDDPITSTKASDNELIQLIRKKTFPVRSSVLHDCKSPMTSILRLRKAPVHSQILHPNDKRLLTQAVRTEPPNAVV
ncbi:hypothetical protein Forpi1262_v014527 [Fusarium oxysporum f. sp. raphani]|uniref:Uncharacterized protein n=1 Tax=Fusarium oxysporum f. sp. raphani TaxID=96318 RepID=A0A8J5U2T7_FUSOX|nr:hypothetical protein Forpi1262_v014527 [Fusarium oxysporum f. sp. raphani]